MTSSISDFSKVELLLPMRGEDNGTEFPDYSPAKKSIARVGNAKTVTSNSKYYGSSAYFDGNGDYLIAPVAVSNTESWTFETWFSTPDYSVKATAGVFLGRHPGANIDGRWYFSISGTGKLRLWCAPSLYDGATTLANDGAWHHAALVVDMEENECRIYLDGVLDAQFARPTFSVAPDVYIGKYFLTSTGEDYLGYMQDLCITIGQAKYSANFTPPQSLLLPAAALSGNAITQQPPGNPVVPVDYVALFAWPNGPRTQIITPDSNGDWATPDGLVRLEYGITYLADGFKPLTHGPYSAT